MRIGAGPSRYDRSWKNFGYDLERVGRSIKELEYRGIFEKPAKSYTYQSLLEDISLGRGSSNSALALHQVDSVLSEIALAPPHGLELLKPLSVPSIPQLPDLPALTAASEYDERKIKKHKTLKARIGAMEASFNAKRQQEESQAAALAAACLQGDPTAIRQLMQITLVRHALPSALEMESSCTLDLSSRVALCTTGIPDLANLPIVRKRGTSYSSPWHSVAAAEKKRSSERILHSLCIRAAYLVAMSDPDDFFDTVTVNAQQKWFDPATGVRREGIVASLQATKTELRALQPGHLDAKACFRHLSGIATPNILAAAPIRPIFVMDTHDERIVQNKDVAEGLREEANLAAMPWEDFEHLVRQLFEWMFTNEGVEVKVTRASRDRGVDAIMFDPDPIKGGKYVLQAKRYTRTVDVAAVRDLYGTIVNEGANRGILVTTASYGPDAYEFAKDKPISLIDGQHLLALLKKHGRSYRIDLEEARRLETAP